MAVPTTYPAGSQTDVGGTSRTLVQPYESIGLPTDAAATDIIEENSAFSLAKGMLAELGLPAGTGSAVVNTTPHIYPDLRVTLGRPSDAPATNPAAANSAISLLKGILVELGL